MPDLHIIPGRHKSKVVFNAGTLDPSPLKTSQISLSHTPPTKQIQRSTMSLQEPVEYTREEMAQVLSRSEKIWSPFVPVTQQRHALPTSCNGHPRCRKTPTPNYWERLPSEMANFPCTVVPDGISLDLVSGSLADVGDTLSQVSWPPE